MVSWRPVLLRSGALMATGLLLAGCSGSGGGKAAGAKGSTTGAGTRSSPTSSSGQSAAAANPSATPSPTAFAFDPDPARLPKTRAQAVRLARAVTAEPVKWGPGFVKRDPYETDPGHWPVLDANCVWQRDSLPPTVLASLTRHSELPAEDGKGPIRVSAVVTVHRTVTDAGWEMAETLEEALRCPDQQLRQGERITGLLSQGAAFGLMGNLTSEDTLSEGGQYYSDELGGPHYYYWTQSRLGQVTVAVAGRGAKGRTEAEVSTAMSQAITQMLTDVETELGAGE
ncbi:hypothetical protein ACFYXF_42655 [Streptomyces sp. NPDC002680]|uniref:hypothetical protein n=1 Tax=Streptomyces sp. NPDC002680 TaxID=3364659 RepID=UPI0036747B44